MIHPITARDRKRFWAKVIMGIEDDDCWFWNASPNQYGYPQFRWGGTVSTAIRFSYRIKRGTPANFDDLECDHDRFCRNPACVNPNHVDLVPKSVNVANGNKARASRRRLIAA